MKNYTKPSLEVVEVSVRENIAALPDGVTTENLDGTVVTTYTLNTYAGTATLS